MIKLIDFYADWCGPCKAMAPIFEEIETEYADKVTFEKVDVESDNDLAAQFGIMSIPTFVILKNDKEIDRKLGAMPKDMLKSWIDSHIK
jgi:thioredoxin 1